MGKAGLVSTVSLQFWYALKRPAIHHPLFRRITRDRVPRPQPKLSLGQQVVIMALLVLPAYFILRYYADMIVVGILFIPLGIAAVYMTLHGTIAGLYWAMRISGAIARERERGSFDLISTSPYGAFSASWAICTGCQYYDQTFNGIGAQRVWFSRIFFLTLLLMSAVISLIEPRSTSAAVNNCLYVSDVVIAVSLAFVIDDIHSAVIGSLIGMIVPLIVRNRLNAHLGALAGFLTLQIGAYALVWLIGFTLLPQVNANLAVGALAASLMLPLEQVLVFFAVRELIARVLWRIHSLLLDDDVSDLSLLTKGGRLIC